MNKQNIVEILPDDVINLILGEISYNDLKSVNRSSQAMRGIIRENKLIENKLIELQKFVDKIDLRGWQKIDNYFSNEYFNISYKNNKINIRKNSEENQEETDDQEGVEDEHEIVVNEFQIYINKSRAVIIENNTIHLFYFSGWSASEYNKFDLQKYSIENIIKIILDINRIFIIFEDEEKETYMLSLKIIDNKYVLYHFDEFFIISRLEQDTYLFLRIYNEFGVNIILEHNGKGWRQLSSYSNHLNNSLNIIYEIQTILNSGIVDQNSYEKIDELVKEINENMREYYKSR